MTQMAIDLEAVKTRLSTAREANRLIGTMRDSDGCQIRLLIQAAFKDADNLIEELSRVSQFLPRATWHVYKPNLYLEMRLVHPLFAYKNVGAIFSYGDKGFRAECFGTRSKMCKSLPVAKAWVQAKVTAKYGVVVTPESEDANA